MKISIKNLSRMLQTNMNKDANEYTKAGKVVFGSPKPPQELLKKSENKY